LRRRLAWNVNPNEKLANDKLSLKIDLPERNFYS
jgi:hypothetical protein